MHFYQFDEWEFYDLRSDPMNTQFVWKPRIQKPDQSNEAELNGLVKKYDDDSDMSVTKPKSWQDEALASPRTKGSK